MFYIISMNNNKERTDRNYTYKKFSIIKDCGWWYSSSPLTDFSDLAETLQDAKNAIDDFYNGFHKEFKQI